MSTDASPSMPTSFLFSPQHSPAARKAPKFIYGRRPPPSSPSEADKSSATLVDADLSPFSKASGKDILGEEIQLSFSSQETRIDVNERGDDTCSPVVHQTGWKKFDDEFHQTNNLLSSTLHPKDNFIPSERSWLKRGANLTPDPEPIEHAEQDNKSPEKFQWGWREKLKEIDEDFAREGSPLHAQTIQDVFSVTVPLSPAGSSRQKRPASPTLQKTWLQPFDSDSEAAVTGRSRSKQVALNPELTHTVDRSEGASSMSELDGKRKPRKRTTKGKEKAGRTKHKRLTKKEMEEVNREQARLLGEQTSFFPRLQKPRPMISVSSLAGRIDPTVTGSSKASSQCNASSDPIQHWSSPMDRTSHLEIPPRTNSLFRLSPKRNLLSSKSVSPTISKSATNLLGPEPNDEDLPSLGHILIGQEQKREKEEMQRKLTEHKKYVLEQQMKKVAGELADAEEDDDLEIVEVKQVRGPQVVEGRRKPSAIIGRPWHGKPGRTKKEELNKILLKQNEEQRKGAIKKKEEEWTKRGGKIQSGILEDGSHEKASWVEKLAKSRGEHDGNEGDEEGSDGEWTAEVPPTGSSIPAPSENGGDENTLEEKELVTVTGGDSGAETEGNEVPILGRRRMRWPRKSNLVDSEDEAKILVPNTSVLRFSQPDRLSVSSVDDVVETETDKENNMDLMFDMSEDKENTLARSHLLPLGSQSGARARSPSNSPRPDARLPFKELRGDKEDNDPDWLASGPRLRKGSLDSDRLFEPAPLLAPVFTAGDSDDDSSPKPAALQGGFSQLFCSGSTAQGRTLSFESPSTQKKPSGFDALRKFDNGAEFSLTLDVGLQPALEVSDVVRQKADSIFEREQEDLLEAANVAKARAKPQLYIDENGFLTQSRPDSTNPEIYRSPPTQTSTQTQRQPLGTIAVSESRKISWDDADSGKRRRLKRYSSTSPNRKSGYRSTSPSPARLPLDAFDLLRKGATAHDKARKRKGAVALGKSEFVQGEAQESDEDDGFGLAKKGDDDDDEESDAENDKPLEGLVNDAEMDAEMEAKEKIVEKFKEHLEEDDVSLEKYHRDAAEGKFRSKRRNRGVDLGDSDSDDDDEEARELRRRIAKKRKIAGDTLDALAKNEETLPFVQAYENGLKETDMLPVIAEQVDVLMGDADEDDENADPRESVSMHEIREQVRKAAWEESVERFDPSNTSWLEDGDEDQDNVRVRTVGHKKAAHRWGEGQAGVDPDQLRFHNKRTEEPEFNDRLNIWAKANGRNSSSAFAPSGGSVTARPKVTTTKQKNTPAGTAGARSEQQKSLKSGKSMLLAVSDKRSRFKFETG